MFVFAYSVLAQLEYAFVLDVRLVLAKPWTDLVLDGSDCIDFGITFLDDCLDARRPSMMPYAPAATSTSAPDHDINH
jgi:hypothetical protein